MRTIKVIPCLDMADGRVVKGVKFVELRDAGDPVELAREYVAQGADELVFLDVKATTENRATTIEMVQKTAANVPISFAVGGGVRSVSDAEKLLAAGANKVGVSSAAIMRPELINEIAAALGSEKLVLAVDVTKHPQMPSGYALVTHGGSRTVEIDAVAWVKEASERGAGEILLTSLDADGTKDGFDLDILKKVCDAVTIPVTASGGAGELQHFVAAAKAGAAAVLAASVFHNGVFSVAEVKEALSAAGFKTL